MKPELVTRLESQYSVCVCRGVYQGEPMEMEAEAEADDTEEETEVHLNLTRPVAPLPPPLPPPYCKVDLLTLCCAVLHASRDSTL